MSKPASLRRHHHSVVIQPIFAHNESACILLEHTGRGGTVGFNPSSEFAPSRSRLFRCWHAALVDNCLRNNIVAVDTEIDTKVGWCASNEIVIVFQCHIAKVTVDDLSHCVCGSSQIELEASPSQSNCF
jgi:hypothetical protein